MLYNRNTDPKLSPFQMLVMRSIFALVFQAIYVNVELKKAVWDSVDRSSAGSLTFRSIQGSLTNIINYNNAAYLPMTIIAIVNNMSPLIAVVLAYFILKEKLKCFEILMIVLTLAGICVVVIFGGSSETATTSTLITVLLYITLAINPFLTAGGTIVMRKMKKFHDATVSWYLNWSILISSLIAIFALREGFQTIIDFDWVSWLLSAGTGLAAVSSQTLRFKALKL